MASAARTPIQTQLAELRKRIASIDRKFVTPPPSPTFRSGTEVTTSVGSHWEMEQLYETHGSMETWRLAELPHTLLGPISAGQIGSVPPERWAFLDTETTGLAGGSGTVAFLIGVGRITSAGFVVRQFLLRDFGEEASVLAALTAHLAEFDVMVTYNGKAFDQPLLETRYRMTRSRTPFGRVEHLDLLFGARRLWKMRFESCRLVELENRILGYTRVGDVGGDLIPLLYFQYLKTKKAGPLEPVFEHNRLDIVSLACLTAIVSRAFDQPHETDLGSGFELIGLGRWMIANDRHDDGLALMRRGIEKTIPDDLLFKTLWEIAITEKKLGRGPGGFAELAHSRNPYRVLALEELAKYYEHRERNLAMALVFAEQALRLERTPELVKRYQRLERKASAPKPRRLL